jgi:oxygen-independent coproporphyrinogen-3 oxidase
MNEADKSQRVRRDPAFRGRTIAIVPSSAGPASPVKVDFPAHDTPKFAALPPLSLYVHIPWCLKKCPYCDFNSHELREDLPESDYVDALLADLEFLD